MFMGPLEASKPWNTRDVPGVHRFLQRIWRMIVGGEDVEPLLGDRADEEIERLLHKTIKKVGDDIEAMRFNTAIAALMEFVNAVYRAKTIAGDQAERFVLLLAPLAPHIAEELWQRLGHDASLARAPWPSYEESMLLAQTLELPVQVNGKVRSRITVAADADEQAVLSAALADEKIAAQIAGKELVKKIVVPGRLVNLVAR
jgi:leucyl-tRNA synthetase